MHPSQSRRAFAALVWAGLLVGSGAMSVAHPEAACVVEVSKDSSGPFKRHVNADCTTAEREANAVEGASVMKALAKGRAVDLVGVVIRGGLLFDRLPVQSVRTPKDLSSEQQDALNRLNAGEVRSVSSPVTIRDSMVQGRLRHRSATGTLQFEGAVDFHGTRFTQGVDLSRSVFQRSVDVSAAVFEQEAYWIQGQFGAAMNCEGTKFGPHTRFHRAIFRGPVECSGALFDGVTEFLEATFEQEAVFANTRFGLGTGFSGSRFTRRVSFADAIFSREAFFTFTRFEADAVFSGAQFLAMADFSNAVFTKADDVSRAHFDRPPLFENAKRQAQGSEIGVTQSTGSQYVVTLALLVVAALLVAYIFRMK
jgi:hypothetical protein